MLQRRYLLKSVDDYVRENASTVVTDPEVQDSAAAQEGSGASMLHVSEETLAAVLTNAVAAALQANVTAAAEPNPEAVTTAGTAAITASAVADERSDTYGAPAGTATRLQHESLSGRTQKGILIGLLCTSCAAAWPARRASLLLRRGKGYALVQRTSA